MKNPSESLPSMEGDLPYGDDASCRDAVEKDLRTTPLGSLASKDYATIDPSATVEETIEQWCEQGQHFSLVVHDDKLVGIFTERDLLTRIGDRYDVFCGDPVELHMTHNPETVEAHVPIVFGLNLMTVGGYRHIPIVSKGKPVGVVSVRDILRYLSGK